jgi:hypothetical protein
MALQARSFGFNLKAFAKEMFLAHKSSTLRRQISSALNIFIQILRLLTD